MGNNLFKKFDKNSRIPEKYNSKYWYYSGVLIPNNIKYVPSRDKMNRVSLHSETEATGCNPPWTPKEYQDKFGVLGRDGKFYWKEQET